jgi:hypothetical protein
MNILYRIDFVFSYWIFTWYLLFIFKYTKYSPKLALIIGIIHNTLLLISMIFYKYNIINILFFCIINICIKIIPLWTLRNNNIYDITATLVLFFIYNIWLYLNKTNMFILFINQHNNIKNNKPVGPVINIMNKIFKINI